MKTDIYADLPFADFDSWSSLRANKRRKSRQFGSEKRSFS
jgi:hypothetical protein